MTTENSLQIKPSYSAHRRGIVAADTTDLTALLAALPNNAINAHGFDSIHGFVEMEGTATPTVTLQVLELVDYDFPAGTPLQRLIQRVTNIGPLGDGDNFDVPTPGGGRFLLRAHAIAGTNPIAHIFIVGGRRSNEGSI
jgi:hypothetical protein